MWLSLSSCHSAGHFFLHTILSLLTFDDSRSQLPCFFLVSALIILFRSSSYATSSQFFPPRHLFTHLTYLFFNLFIFLPLPSSLTCMLDPPRLCAFFLSHHPFLLSSLWLFDFLIEFLYYSFVFS